MSRAQARFERFRMAQQALFEAEERLTKRIHEEMKETEEFNTMEQELQRLLSDKATMVGLCPFNESALSHVTNRPRSKK